MSTKIRLKRIGRRNRPFYRLIVIDSRKRRDGAAIEQVGWYNPIDPENSYEIKDDRILHWLREGAIPSNAVKKIMKREGLALRWHLMQQGVAEKEIEKRGFKSTLTNRVNEMEEINGKADILRWEILYEYGGVFVDKLCHHPTKGFDSQGQRCDIQ